MKYIDADRLRAEIERLNSLVPYVNNDRHSEGLHDAYKAVKNVIDSLQQDEKAVELEMCSQAYWEERGWMMIPPDVTLKGIEHLLEQVRKKLQREQQMPDSTQLIAEWEKEKAVLEQKDFRGDAERMAYNAFLDGFVKGLGYEGTK